MRSLDVGVIGAGTAGCAAAIFLARAGHRVTIYERVARPTAVGAGITIQPTGLHVLAALGLHEAILGRGSRIERLACATRNGRSLVDLAYRRVDASSFGLGLHRGVLFEALFAAAEGAGARIAAGVSVAELRRVSRRWSMIDDAGHAHGSHELVVVADGARSRLRDRAGTHKQVTPYPWGALWAVVPDHRVALDPDDPNTRAIVQVADGNRRFLGLLPTGLGPLGTTPLVSIFWSIRASEVDAWRARGITAWKDEARALMPEAAPLLDEVHAEEEMLFAGYFDVVMNRWATRSVVYLGDAAHATSPQLGQGSNLALWDAMVLAAVLDTEPRDLACALDAYVRARRAHLAFYQFATRWLTPFFQGDASALGAMRDVAMPLVGRIPFFERTMTRVMMGTANGFLGASIDMPSRIPPQSVEIRP